MVNRKDNQWILMLITPRDFGDTGKEKESIQKYDDLRSVLLMNFGVNCFSVALSLASCIFFWCVISF